ncbi:methyl-accepting chemotaxis protein [Gynuella sunshinyii]|uniref:Methyl-accepting chemotaxis protein n=1 Tax=Gynuella sunshinyii YC6258 TaxID=1445510 RepID=A0A0C5VSN0_9GAMM|nr:PAS domain-containing methyl-accepting chemotaxis protein [Gynuella sunshinyii]AJQ93279.1 methyl-accepting chemotaxis protein [Gynuella sunshinyii YC6258]
MLKIFQNSSDTKQLLDDLQRFKDLVEQSSPVIEFDVNGKVITANAMFQALSGYSLAELSGMTHQQLYRAGFSSEDEYRSYWRQVCQGNTKSSHRQLQVKGDRKLWVSSVIIPSKGPDNRVVKLFEINTDVTALADMADIRLKAKLEAFDRSNAIIEFSPTGEVLTANKNFLETMGYRLEEIAGKHHRMFCDNEYVASDEYRHFWSRLSRGEYVRSRFKRLGKHDRVVWLEASYNPVFDEHGKVVKVVKLATDITENVAQSELEAQNASRAYHIASETERVAEHGTEVIQSAAQEMKNIAESISQSADVVAELGRQSGEITAIVNTIRGIADQTNLLALNAAIEAARAGDQGRGFAVVADEVRQLAGRTSQSTQEISTMIEKMQSGTDTAIKSMNSCQNQAQHGVDLATQAGAVIIQIRDGAKDAVEAVSMFADVMDERDAVNYR